MQLVISDAHEGLKGAIAAVLLGDPWQRFRVHFLRNVLTRIPKGSAEMVLAEHRGTPTSGRLRAATGAPTSKDV